MTIKRIVNHHKLQRKFNNRIKSTKNFFSSFLWRKKTRKDFSWKGRELENPFLHQEEKDHFFLKILIIVSSITVTLSIFIFHPFFSINNVEVNGLQRIDKNDLLNTVNGILNYQKFGFISGRSYLLADINEIKEIIKERYPLEKIIVKKSFPNKIDILIQEKISTVIYDNGQEYSYVDLNGKVVELMRKVSDYEWKDITEKVTTTTPEGETVTTTIIIDKLHEPDITSIKNDLGTYPIIYDKNNTQKVGINEKVLDDVHVKVLIDWYKYLDSNQNLPLKYFIFENNTQDLIIKTYKGTYIKTRFDREVSTQINLIENLYKEKIKNPEQFITYIDLRYKDRIYWR